MNKVKEIVKQLQREERDERSIIHKKYAIKIAEAYAECNHEYGEWFIRTGTVIEDTNIFGEYFQHRRCKHCGHEQTKLPSRDDEVTP